MKLLENEIAGNMWLPAKKEGGKECTQDPAPLRSIHSSWHGAQESPRRSPQNPNRHLDDLETLSQLCYKIWLLQEPAGSQPHMEDSVQASSPGVTPRDGSVGKVPETKAHGPVFRSPEPTWKAVVQSRMGEGGQRLWVPKVPRQASPAETMKTTGSIRKPVSKTKMESNLVKAFNADLRLPHMHSTHACAHTRIHIHTQTYTCTHI